MDPALPILPLPAKAVAQIKSSIAITSLNTVVVELLKNSLDAQSDRIDIEVEYLLGNCVVEDNGLGIQPLEFAEGGGLGKLHHTSKFNSIIPAHGSRGAFIASLAALSLLSITSHHYLHHSQNSLIINRSQVIARQTPTPPQKHIYVHKHGTRVTVRDLFGNMPVRVKQRSGGSSRMSGGGREWEELKRCITSIVLAWPSPVVVIFKGGSPGRKFQLRGQRQVNSLANFQDERNLVTNVCNTLSQALFISSPDRSKWVPVELSTPRVRIRGAISLEPAPTKSVQFLSLGIEPLYSYNGHGLLYDEINLLFESSTFGTEVELSGPDIMERRGADDHWQRKNTGFTSKELRGTRKGLDKWPIFFIKIEILDPVSHRQKSTTFDLVEDREGSITLVIELLQAMISEFLRSHNFRPKSSRRADARHKRHTEKVKDTAQDDFSSGESTAITSGKQIHLKRIGSPFDRWSRVKSGRPAQRKIIPEHVYEHENLVFQAKLEKLSTVDITGKASDCSPSDLHSDRPSQSHDNRTIAPTGKVVRPPFDDVVQGRAKTVSSPSPSLKSPVLVPDWKETNNESDFLNWVNPITKMESSINCRTGLVTKPSEIERLKPHVPSILYHGEKSESATTDNEALSGVPNSIDSSTTWIRSVLRNWKNPVYFPRETGIPQIARDDSENESRQLIRGNGHEYSQLDIDRAFHQSSTSFHGQISKQGLRSAEVISQVDGKFILAKISNITLPSDYGEAISEILVIIDQHAADERCRIEGLLDEICRPPVIDERLPNTASTQPRVITTVLENPISFVMPLREIQLLRTHSQHFANWGIFYDLPSDLSTSNPRREYTLIVKSLPPPILERCKTVPRLLVELLRSEIWKKSEKEAQSNDFENESDDIDSIPKHSWLKRIQNCPSALLEMLNSRACRSAIMFNDELSHRQCTALISRLAECAFPFQCAHGRPSMVPLVNLGSFSHESLLNGATDVQDTEPFGVTFQRWKKEGLSTSND